MKDLKNKKKRLLWTCMSTGVISDAATFYDAFLEKLNLSHTHSSWRCSFYLHLGIKIPIRGVKWLNVILTTSRSRTHAVEGPW